jgi:hypothetical protein
VTANEEHLYDQSGEGRVRAQLSVVKKTLLGRRHVTCFGPNAGPSSGLEKYLMREICSTGGKGIVHGKDIFRDLMMSQQWDRNMSSTQ